MHHEFLAILDGRGFFKNLEKRKIKKMEGQQDANQDDLIMKQQKEIEKEISEQYALISDELPISSMLSEYADDAVYKKKVKFWNWIGS